MKIDALRSQLTGSAAVWFSSTYTKLGDSDWPKWKADFETFGIKNWAKVRTAYNYRYISGAYIDYVLTKEKMILDVDQKTNEAVIVNLIVIGLPTEVQEKLDTKIESTIKLREALARIEISSTAKQHNQQPQNKSFNNNNNKAKSGYVNKPCPICTQAGFHRFHPIDVCRTLKQATFEKAQRPNYSVNLFEQDDQLELVQFNADSARVQSSDQTEKRSGNE